MIVNGVFKVLDVDRRSCHGGTGVWPPGVWRTVNGPLVPCENGLHLCRERDLIDWLGPTIWRAEYDDSDVIEHGDKLVVRRARIVSQVETWDERTARLFAADCAERALPVYEAAHPGDPRPRDAIRVSRRYANGDATAAELTAARDAARAAPWAAARALAGGAAWAPSRKAERAWRTARLMEYLRGEATA